MTQKPGVEPNLAALNSEQGVLSAPEASLIAAKGDLILSHFAVPDADAMVSRTDSGKRPQLRLPYIRWYLEFLEIIVLHERIIVGSWDICPEIPRDIRDSAEFKRHTGRFYITGALDITQTVLDRLREENVLYFIQPMLRDGSAGKYLDAYLRCSTALQTEHNESLQYLTHEGVHSPHRDLIVRWNLVNRYGRPAYLSEFARDAGVPYLLAPFEIRDVTWLEETEVRLRESVMGHLKSHLDSGARREVERLKEFGYETVFPETPIASHILQESASPEDMLLVALELRKEYASFRAHVNQLEAQLLDDHVNLQKKQKLLVNLQALADELWPQKSDSLRQQTKELSGLLNAVPESLAASSFLDIPSLAAKLLAQPADIIMRSLRRRKVRMMLKSKRKFLSSSDWAGKLSSVFSLTPQDVRDSFRDDFVLWPEHKVPPDTKGNHPMGGNAQQ